MKVECPYCKYQNKVRKREVKVAKGWAIIPIHTKICVNCKKQFRFVIKNGKVEIVVPKKTSNTSG